MHFMFQRRFIFPFVNGIPEWSWSAASGVRGGQLGLAGPAPREDPCHPMPSPSASSQLSKTLVSFKMLPVM